MLEGFVENTDEPLLGDRYKSGEVRIPPIPSIQLSLSEGRTPGQKIRRFQQHVAKSELPEPDDSR